MISWNLIHRFSKLLKLHFRVIAVFTPIEGLFPLSKVALSSM